MIVFVRLS